MFVIYMYIYVYLFIFNIYMYIYKPAAYGLNVRPEWRRTPSTTSIPAGHAQATKQETKLAYKPATYPKAIKPAKNARWESSLWATHSIDPTIDIRARTHSIDGLTQQARTHSAECGPIVWHPAQATQAQPSKRLTAMLSLIQELGATCSDKQVRVICPYIYIYMYTY